MNSDSHPVPATQAKRLFGDLLNECVYGRKNIVITRHERPVAVLVRIEEWQRRQAEEETTKGAEDKEEEPQYRSAYMRKIAAWKKRVRDQMTPEQLKLMRDHPLDAVTLIRQIREEAAEDTHGLEEKHD